MKLNSFKATHNMNYLALDSDQLTF